MDKIRIRNQKILEKAIKKLGGKDKFVETIQQYVPKFSKMILHGWLNTSRGLGTPWQYCLLIDFLTDGEFNTLNLRYDMEEGIRKALK